MEINLRTASQEDYGFLYELHRETMQGVIEKTWGWDEVRHRTDFDRRVGEYQWFVIEWGDRAVGGVLLESLLDSTYVHELQVTPQFQNRGIGTAVIRRLIDEAGRQGMGVTLSVVEANGRARRLYERLGFRVTEVEAPFYRMRCEGR
jgi:ribosomal protein S18 acetylase RimI-like enzyme